MPWIWPEAAASRGKSGPSISSVNWAPASWNSGAWKGKTDRKPGMPVTTGMKRSRNSSWDFGSVASGLSITPPPLKPVARTKK